MRRKHGDLRTLADRQQGVRRGLTIGQHQHRGLQPHDAGNPPCAVFWRGIGDVGNLAHPQNLHAVGVDVIEVAHQVGTRAGCAHRHLVKAPLGSPQAGQPFPFQAAAKFFKKDVSTDGGGFQGLLNRLAGGDVLGHLGRLPARDQAVQLGGIGARTELGTQLGIA